MSAGYFPKPKGYARLSAVGAIGLAFVLLDARGNTSLDSGPDTPREAYNFGGGLTRDSLEEAAQAPPPAVQPPRSGKKLARQRSRRTRSTEHGITARQAKEKRRNLLVSFIYHWNGWVIHTFHTTKGTLRLRQIGFAG